MRKQFLNFVQTLRRDEAGGETLEYALVGGLIVLGALSVIGQVGAKVLAKWTSLNNRL